MILEGLVTTCSPTDTLHLAPMGPRVESAAFDRFVLRPFATSQTYRNLLAHPEGVLHITDDSLLLARAAIGRIPTLPPNRAAERIRGYVLADACRAFEFRITRCDDSYERVELTAEVVHTHEQRPFFGFHRARHAVLEVAILATRVHLQPRADIEAELARWQTIVDKTGGDDEFQAMRELRAYLAECWGRGPT